MQKKVRSILALSSLQIPKVALAAYRCGNCRTVFASLSHPKNHPLCVRCGSDNIKIEHNPANIPEDLHEVSQDKLASVKCADCNSFNVFTLSTAEVLGGKMHCAACGGTIIYSMDEEDEQAAQETAPAGSTGPMENAPGQKGRDESEDLNQVPECLEDEGNENPALQHDQAEERKQSSQAPVKANNSGKSDQEHVLDLDRAYPNRGLEQDSSTKKTVALDAIDPDNPGLGEGDNDMPDDVTVEPAPTTGPLTEGSTASTKPVPKSDPSSSSKPSSSSSSSSINPNTKATSAEEETVSKLVKSGQVELPGDDKAPGERGLNRGKRLNQVPEDICDDIEEEVTPATKASKEEATAQLRKRLHAKARRLRARAAALRALSDNLNVEDIDENTGEGENTGDLTYHDDDDFDMHVSSDADGTTGPLEDEPGEKGLNRGAELNEVLEGGEAGEGDALPRPQMGNKNAPVKASKQVKAIGPDPELTEQDKEKAERAEDSDKSLNMVPSDEEDTEPEFSLETDEDEELENELNADLQDDDVDLDEKDNDSLDDLSEESSSEDTQEDYGADESVDTATAEENPTDDDDLSFIEEEEKEGDEEEDAAFIKAGDENDEDEDEDDDGEEEESTFRTKAADSEDAEEDAEEKAEEEEEAKEEKEGGDVESSKQAVTMSLLDVALASFGSNAVARFSRIGPRIVAFVNDVSVATLHQSAIPAEAVEAFNSKVYMEAIRNHTNQHGLASTIDEFGFTPVTVKASQKQIKAFYDSKTTAMAKVAVESKIKEFGQEFRPCLGIAAVGLTKGFWKNESNVIKDNLVGKLTQLGMRKNAAASVVDEVFAVHAEDYHRKLVEKAFTIFEKDPQFRQALADAVGDMTYQHSVAADEGEEDEEIESIESRLSNPFTKASDAGENDEDSVEEKEESSVRNSAVASLIDAQRKGKHLF